MTRRPRDRKLLYTLLLLLAYPGLVKLALDVVRSSPERVAERVKGWEAAAAAAGRRFSVPVPLVLGVVAAESEGNPDARSAKGAIGLMQLLPDTAREQAALLGLSPITEEDLADAELNVVLGTRYLKTQLDRFGHEALALAAYHAGPARVDGWIRGHPGESPEEVLEKSAFPSTRAYVATVLEYRARFAKRE